MKSRLFTLLLFCFWAVSFSQENSLFLEDNQDFWNSLSIKKNDSSLLKQLLNDNKLTNSYTIPNLHQIIRRKQFLESENSATKNPMPIYQSKDNFKHKSIFPDNTLNYYLLIESVKER